jgi:hypothetical protein
MRNANGLSVRIRRWELTHQSIQPFLPEMPHLEPLQTEIQTVLGAAKELHTEQEDLRSKLRDVMNRRRDLERTGDIVRRRIEAHLRGSFGHTSEKLIGFGVSPRPRVTRRKKKKEQEKTAASTGTAQTASS